MVFSTALRFLWPVVFYLVLFKNSMASSGNDAVAVRVVAASCATSLNNRDVAVPGGRQGARMTARRAQRPEVELDTNVIKTVMATAYGKEIGKFNRLILHWSGTQAFGFTGESTCLASH